MNNYRIVLFSALFLFSFSIRCLAQNINWKQLTPENKHLVYAGFGFNFGTGAALGYGYRLQTTLPILLNAEFSAPFGNTVFDDFKSKLGGQTELWRAGNFSAAVKIYGNFRRYESNYARLLSFGSETGALFGFYKSKWYVAAEFVFDKAISTHVQHTPVVEENNPNIRDGWYVPTGGNFLYGIQSGFSVGKNDLNVSLGRMVTQDFKTTPLPPLYVRLGYNRRF